MTNSMNPFVTPLHEGNDNRQEVAALFGQGVIPRVASADDGPALHDPFRNKLGQAVAQHVYDVYQRAITQTHGAGERTVSTTPKMNDMFTSIIENMKKEYKEFYIVVVGHINQRTSDINEHCILGKMTSIVVRDKVPILFVDDEIQFLYIMKSLFDKLQSCAPIQV